MVVAEPWSPAGARHALAMGAAAAFHALVLVLLTWRLGLQPEAPAPPIVNIDLTPPWRPHVVSPRLDREGRRRAPATARPVGRADEPRGAPPVAATGLARSADGAAAEAVRPVLRGLLGCEQARLLGLTAEERQHCLDRLAEARAAAPTTLNLDARGAFGREPEPYLARKPTRGCKPRAAGDAGPMGNEGAAAGLACAWSF
jgi:hypothetical protein